MKQIIIGVCLIATAACTGHSTTSQITGASPAPQGLIAAPATPTARCHSVNGRADRLCNPGLAAHSTDVMADAPKYLHTLCQPQGVTPRWIAKRRPPVSYTNSLKVQEMAAYGYPGDPKLYEEDHIVSLELDGDSGHTAYAPSGMPANLYPEPWEGTSGAHLKDKEENLLHRQVCSGALTLQQAQDKLITDWVH